MAYVLSGAAFGAMIVNVMDNNANGALVCFLSSVALWLSGKSLYMTNKQELESLNKNIEIKKKVIESYLAHLDDLMKL